MAVFRHGCTAVQGMLMLRPILLAGLTTVLTPAPHAETAPTPKHTIRQPQPYTGSNIRLHVVGSGDVPINLSYAQLSPENRAAFNRNYEVMEPGDEPPFPMGGLQVVLGPIQRLQEVLQVTGDLLLVARVSATGVAQEIKAYDSPSPEMTKMAAQVLLLTRFKPAICSGQPCSMEFPLRLQFQLR